MNYKTSFCSLQQLLNVPNALSESWDRKIHKYMGYFFKFPRELVKTERLAFLNQSFKITFVRHPFVRLVSTFQDKLIGRASF